ncbi:MAG: hypothetical protein IPN90_05475, partial [Elusimicrobia bacterium]|nr:hypothetical protein [Elusimicrobiota bacterium]
MVFALLKAEAYVRILYEDEKIQILSLEAFRDRRANKWANNGIPEWDSFRVVYDGHFLLSETPIDPGAKTAEVESSDHRAGLLALAGYLNLSGAEQLQDVPLAEKIEDALKAHPGESVPIPGQYEDGLIAVFAHAKHRNAPPVQTFFNNGRETSFPESLDGYLSKRDSQKTIWENYYVIYNDIGRGVPFFSVFPNPKVVEDISSEEDENTETVSVKEREGAFDRSLEPVSSGDAFVDVDQKSATEVLVKQKTDSSEDRAYRKFFLKVVGKTFRVTMVLMTAVLLTSWGEAFVSSVEGAFSKMISKPEAHEMRVGPQSAAPQPQFIIPENAPRAFVDTKKTPLISFDRSPAEKNRVMGRVGVHSSVKIIERKGSWVLVSQKSGKRGWVSSRHLREGQGGRMTVARSAPLLERRPAVRMANLPKGAELVVLGFEGKWVRVMSVENPGLPVWVSREYVSESRSDKPANDAMKTSMAQNEAIPFPTLSAEAVYDGVQEVLGLMGRPLPVLGEIAQ